jgi:hypothetical protein
MVVGRLGLVLDLGNEVVESLWCRYVLQNVNGGHQTSGARVVVKRAARNVFELLIANLLRLLDLFAHGISRLGLVGFGPRKRG